jgi:hypothetical protein
LGRITQNYYNHTNAQANIKSNNIKKKNFFLIDCVLSDFNLTAINHYGKKLSNIECNGSVKFINPGKGKVKVLIGGKLYVDNRDMVNIYEDGFCVENFVDQQENFSAISAYVCFPFVPSMNLTSNSKQVKHHLNVFFLSPFYIFDDFP